jgi:hypothetical protein
VLTPIIFEGSRPLLKSDLGTAVGDQYNQTPLLRFADEGAVGIRSVHDELIDERVKAVSPWRTYGPRAASRLIDFSLAHTQWDRASVGVPPAGWAGPPQQAGCNAALFQGTVTFKRGLNVSSLRLLRNWHWVPSLPLHLVVGRGATILQDIDIAAGQGQQSFRLERGDWFGFYSPATANSQLFLNRGAALELRLGQPPDSSWLTLWAAMDNPRVAAGDSYAYELFSVGCPLDAAAHSAATLRDQIAYLARPESLQVTRGRRGDPSGPFETTHAGGYAVHIVVPRPTAVRDLPVPLIVRDLNPRWSAGLWQLRGFVKGDYGGGANRYRSVAVDLDGRAYVPLYPDLAPWTEVEVGHPVSADLAGAGLFIQVTALSGGTDAAPGYEWAVEVNNPTDQPITSTLRQRMALPGLNFGTQTIALAAGEHRVLYRSAVAPTPTTTAPSFSTTPTKSATRTATATITRTSTRTPTQATAGAAAAQSGGSYAVAVSPTPTPTATPAMQ